MAAMQNDKVDFDEWVASAGFIDWHRNIGTALFFTVLIAALVWGSARLIVQLHGVISEDGVNLVRLAIIVFWLVCCHRAWHNFLDRFQLDVDAYARWWEPFVILNHVRLYRRCRDRLERDRLRRYGPAINAAASWVEYELARRYNSPSSRFSTINQTIAAALWAHVRSHDITAPNGAFSEIVLPKDLVLWPTRHKDHSHDLSTATYSLNEDWAYVNRVQVYTGHHFTTKRFEGRWAGRSDGITSREYRFIKLREFWTYGNMRE